MSTLALHWRLTGRSHVRSLAYRRCARQLAWALISNIDVPRDPVSFEIKDAGGSWRAVWAGGVAGGTVTVTGDGVSAVHLQAVPGPHGTDVHQAERACRAARLAHVQAVDRLVALARRDWPWLVAEIFETFEDLEAVGLARRTHAAAEPMWFACSWRGSGRKPNGLALALPASALPSDADAWWLRRDGELERWADAPF